MVRCKDGSVWYINPDTGRVTMISPPQLKTKH